MYKAFMKTPITYYGGKQLMLKHILPLVPVHSTYTEAFCGGAALFFAKEPAHCEVINDLNMHLINFYKVLKGQYHKLKCRVEQTLHSRDTHRHATHVLACPDFFDEIERAWAVWALAKCSFASKLDGTFGYDFKGGMPKKVRFAKESFDEHLSSRLEHCTIESRDALNIIQLYDREDAFHFVDPPYVGSDCGHYSGMFSEDDLGHLLDLLSQIKGKFMLTMYPNETIQRYADSLGWQIHKITRFVSAGRSSRKHKEEWIICNYQVEHKEGEQ